MAIQYDPSENQTTGIPFSNGSEEAGLVTKKSEGGAFTNETVGEYGTALSAASEAVQAKLDAETAKAAAEAAQIAAELAEANAETAETNAETAEANAETAQGLAEDAQSYAEEWATKAEDSLISTEAGGDGSTDYSALHHAAKASASETAAALSESNASDSEDAAFISESNAADSASDASKLAVNAEDSQYTLSDGSTTGYSALHYNAKAQAAKLAAESARDTTLAAYDNFDDRYLGVKSSDPTLDNDGAALVAGAIYFNDQESTMKIWDGSLWYDAYADGRLFLRKDQNLFDLTDTSEARDNLGLGTTATTDTTAYATAAQGTTADSAVQPGDLADVATSGSYNDLSDVPTNVSTFTNDADYIVDGTDATVSSLQLTGGGATEGTLSWNGLNDTVNLEMGNGVIQQIGEEVYYPKNTFNNTGSTIPNGTPVMLVGGTGDASYIAPALSSSAYDHNLYVGITTEEIVDQAYGRVLYFGSVNDVDTSAYNKNDLLYVSSTVAGGFTTTKPSSPNHAILAALVTKVDATTGRLFVRTHVNPEASEITYDNTESGLVASNVKSAIDELNDTKASIELLSSNIILYPTTASSNVSGYNRMVISTSDSDYNTTAVDVSTGTISTDDQLIASLIADAGLFVGNPGVITIPTIGNIAKVAGNSEQYASFYFTVLKRDSGGTETLIATSSSTGAINPSDTDYRQFSASALFSNGDWLETDRVVIKYYAELLGNTGSSYNFQFGGSSPVYTNLPVPISVIPSSLAEDIRVSTVGFSGILSGTDDDVQAALNTIDDHAHDSAYAPLAGYNNSNWDTAYGWGDHSTQGYATEEFATAMAIALG